MQIDFWEIVKSWWPIWIPLLIIIIMRIFFDWLELEIDSWRIRQRFKKGEKWRSDRDLLQWLRGMKPSEFEKYIADLFTRLGYETKTVGTSHDGGIDVIAEKDGVKNYIQCKKFISSKVSVGDIRNFYGALADHLTNGKGYFITTNKFTLEAEKFAEDKPIELIDGFRLIKYINMTKKDKSELKEEDRACPRCDGNLVKRTGKFGEFYGCSNYPKCDYTTKN